jgi:hypothetical protein
VTTIRVAPGEPLVTGMAMATDVAVAACGRVGTTGITSGIAKQMGV